MKPGFWKWTNTGKVDWPEAGFVYKGLHVRGNVLSGGSSDQGDVWASQNQMTGSSTSPSLGGQKERGGGIRLHTWRFPRESNTLAGKKVGIGPPSPANPGAQGQLSRAQSWRSVWEEWEATPGKGAGVRGRERRCSVSRFEEEPGAQGGPPHTSYG